MAIQEHELYCEEDKNWEEEEKDAEDCAQNAKNPSLFFPLFLEQEFFCEDDELLSLFSKEQEQHKQQKKLKFSDRFVGRFEAVEWMLKVNAHYGYAAFTAILAVNYLDRFLSSLHFEKDKKPWMMQLVAVTCLSLAAKVEETQMPLLLDLQVEDSKYVFEAKTIQRMELLVLSALQWKMHPVTPISFLDHIIRRLGLKTHLHLEFLRLCERLLLSLLSDSRIVDYLPSVLATATMMHVIDQVEPRNSIEYQNQLLVVLKISKEKVRDCYELILGLSNTHFHDHDHDHDHDQNPHKRKYNEPNPSSPSIVIDAFFSRDCSNDSWVLGQSSVSSSPEPLLKKSRAQNQQMQMHLPSLNRIFVDILGSPH